jgi:hypothetical protein
VGFYVVITSVQPLVAYVHFSFAELGFTADEYKGSSTQADSTRSGWVIDNESLQPAERKWRLRGLKLLLERMLRACRHFHCVPATATDVNCTVEAARAHFGDTSKGNGPDFLATSARVLAWLASHGLDSQAIWFEAQSQIVQVRGGGAG